MNPVGTTWGPANWGPPRAELQPSGPREGECFDRTLWISLVSSDPWLFQRPEELILGGGGGRGKEPRSVGMGRWSEPSVSGSRRSDIPGASRDQEEAREASRNSGRPSQRPEGSSRAVGVKSGAPDGGSSSSGTASEETAKPGGGESAAIRSARVQEGTTSGPAVGRFTVASAGGLRAAALRGKGLPMAATSQMLSGGRASGTSTAQKVRLGGTAGSPSGMVLVPFKDAGGHEGRIRLALRGNALHATILSPSKETVLRLESRISELQRALGERGFLDTRLSVRQAGEQGLADPRSESGHDAERDRDDPAGTRRETDRDPGGRQRPKSKYGKERRSS